MNKLISFEQLSEIFQVIHDHPNAKLSELAQKVGLDLTKDYIGADFSGEDLSQDNLKYANFTGADLSNANLSCTDLSVANLINVNLAGANLTNANLSGADLTGANLTNANLSGADLIGADLINANLSGADLTKANLINACLRGADLTKANLIDACLRGADLSGAILENSNLSNANLIDTNLTNVDFNHADLRNTDLSGAILAGTNLSGAKLDNSNLSNANFIDTDCTDANLSNANLTNVDSQDADQINCLNSINRRNNSIKTFEELIKADQKIISAASELDRSEIIFDDICKKIEEKFKFDFISISLVMPEQNTIETVYGTGIAKQLVDRVRHPIQENEKLRDIQADIVKTGQTEIISGWDDRFDRGVYDRFGHDKLIRIFTPIFLFYDEKKDVIVDWFQSYDWQENFIQKQQDGRTVFYMKQPPSNATPQIIGTLEAGYENRDRLITSEQASLLAQLLAEQALKIRRISLHYVLETIAESARRFFNANLATLHFLWEPQGRQEGKYIYEVFKGDIGAKPLDEFSPRNNGLGQLAIDQKQVQVLYYSQTKNNCNIIFSEKAHLRGVKAYAAFPLLINTIDEIIPRSISTIRKQEDEQLNTILKGVLYVHFREESQFTKELIRLGKYFVEKAVDAITSVIKYQRVREEARQLSALQSITQSFNEIGSNLVNYIAWNAMNALAADVVIIYEFFQIGERLHTPPTVAGKFLDEDKMRIETNEHTVTQMLIQGGKNIYASQIVDEPIFKDSSFAQREKILSAAGILLKANNDIVGVMFINYRRIHRFSNEEKQIIDSLASSAATAIHNYRWMQSLDSIERQIITEQETLKLVVEKAVEITGAEVGEISTCPPNTEKLITFGYPNTQVSKSVASWEEVKTYEKSRIVNDIKIQQNYKPYFHGANSELSVPLLDKNGDLRGVLIVASYENKEFTKVNLQKLEYIAGLALIAIQYAEKEEAVQKQTIATIDHLSRKLLSKINNDVGTTKVVLNILEKENNSSLNEVDKTLETLTVANDVKETINNLTNKVKETISNLNKDNVESSKDKVNTSLSQLNEQDKNLQQLAGVK
ncbi:pentapeptide repeat-containing protein [Nostoc sp. CENA67]|uniref:Pentapeptide repeat-containing protein n=1 Tax=Amazonocrinis nigriterrae CENA67 TaxID=2794033 RepID=A0A8J7HVL7_9NOST|nr:pentapeptide repeat-containing protein [Amazonocrinis nigriterrae]MBH8566666.1 pentapeptide repeat-containing protein [Amazonocrinis nigriterrae CENA67]